MTSSNWVWLAAALLHREHPGKDDFSSQEIFEKALQISDGKQQPQSLRQHISTHAVANKEPHAAPYKLLWETSRGRRRLFRKGDPAHVARVGRTHPTPSELPAQYRDLVDWYLSDYDREALGPVTRRSGPGSGTSGHVLFGFFGTMSRESAEEIAGIIERECRQIDKDAW